MEKETVFHTVPLARRRLTFWFVFHFICFCIGICVIIIPEHISPLSPALSTRIAGVIITILFGYIVVFHGIQLFVQKRALEISNKGIREFTLFSTILYPWSEIEAIGLGESPWLLNKLKYVGLTLREPEKFFAGKSSRVRRIYQALQKQKQPYHVAFVKDCSAIDPESLFATLAAFFSEFSSETPDSPPNDPRT